MTWPGLCGYLPALAQDISIIIDKRPVMVPWISWRRELEAAGQYHAKKGANQLRPNPKRQTIIWGEYMRQLCFQNHIKSAKSE